MEDERIYVIAPKMGDIHEAIQSAERGLLNAPEFQVAVLLALEELQGRVRALCAKAGM